MLIHARDPARSDVPCRRHRRCTRRGYPRDSLAGATDAIYWTVDAAPRRRVLRIMHAVLYSPANLAGAGMPSGGLLNIRGRVRNAIQERLLADLGRLKRELERAWLQPTR
jgi:hypothetical protein